MKLSQTMADRQVNRQQSSQHRDDNMPPQDRLRNQNSGLLQNFLKKFENYTIYGTLFIYPFLFLPSMWGGGDFIRSYLIVFAAIILFLINVAKFLSGMQLSLRRSAFDIFIFSFITAAVISTLLSVSTDISLFGYRLRFASGLITLIGIIVFSYEVRLAAKTSKALLNIVSAAIYGLGMSAFLSLISYTVGHPFGIFSYWDQFILDGQTMFESTETAVFSWMCNILFALFALSWSFVVEKNNVRVFLISISAVFSILATFIFSAAISVITVIFFVVSVFLSIYMLSQTSISVLKKNLTFLYVLAFASVGFVVVSLIPFVQESIANSGNPILVPIKLSSEFSWDIVAGRISSDVKSGTFGAGYNTYGTYFNSEINGLTDGSGIDFSTRTLPNANSTVLDLLGNIGITGALVWMIGGLISCYILFKVFQKIYVSKQQNYALYASMLVIPIFVFLSGFISFIGTEGLLYLILAMNFAVLIQSMINPADDNVMNFKLDINTKNNDGAWLIPSAIFGVLLLSSLIISYFGLMRVSSYFSTIAVTNNYREFVLSLQEGDDSEIDYESAVGELAIIANDYNRILDRDGNNYEVVKLRVQVISDIVNLTSQELQQIAIDEGYDELSEEELEELEPTQEYENLANVFNQYIDVSNDSVTRATDLAPNIYDNWRVKSNVLSQIVVDYSRLDYLEEAKVAHQNALGLNRIDYERAYSLAQVYAVEESFDQAFDTITAALRVNPTHLRSLIFAAQLTASSSPDAAVSYLDAAVEVMDANGMDEVEQFDALYDYVSELRVAIESGEVASPQESLPEEVEEGVDQFDGESDELNGGSDFGIDGADESELPAF